MRSGTRSRASTMRMNGKVSRSMAPRFTRSPRPSRGCEPSPGGWCGHCSVARAHADAARCESLRPDRRAGVAPAAGAAGDPGGSDRHTTSGGIVPALDALFSSGRIGRLETKNRLVMPPMVRNYADEHGRATSRYRAHIERIARGGVGAMILEASFVRPDGRGFSRGLGLHDDAVIDGLAT